MLASLKDRQYLEIVLDWTQIRKDHVLVFSIPYHKRSISLFWIVASPEDYSPNELERECVCRFLAVTPADLRNKLVFVADRGFAKAEFFQFLTELHVKFVIRVCGQVWIKSRSYKGWIKRAPLSSRRVKWIVDVMYHKTKGITFNLLLKYIKDDPWYIASNIDDVDTVFGMYVRRMTIEEGFRDIKDGLMFKRLRVSNAAKVGKMLLAGVLVYLFALIIGSQAERCPELVQCISTLPKRKGSKILLSVFRIGLILIGRCQSINSPLHLVPEKL